MKNLIRNIMTTNVVTLTTDASLQHIEEYIQRYPYQYFPVVHNERLVGIISRLDIISKVQNWNSLLGRTEDSNLKTAGEFMITNILKTSPDTSIRTAIHQMKNYKSGILCVVDEQQRILGIVTLFDLINRHIYKSVYNGNAERLRLLRE